MNLEEGVIIRLFRGSEPFTAKSVPCIRGCGGSANIEDALKEHLSKDIDVINDTAKLKKEYAELYGKLKKRNIDLYNFFRELNLWQRKFDWRTSRGYAGASALDRVLNLKCSKCGAFCGQLDVRIEIEGFDAPSQIDIELLKALPKPKPEVLSYVCKELGLFKIDDIGNYINNGFLEPLKATVRKAVEEINSIKGLPSEMKNDFNDFSTEYLNWAGKQVAGNLNRYLNTVNKLAQEAAGHQYTHEA